LELTRDNFLMYSQQYIERILMKSDLRERAAEFSNVMERAREFGLEQQTSELAVSIAMEFNEPELWELPEQFEKQIQLSPFPVDSLPETLSAYLKAVCGFVQVTPEMGALPLLSVLSLCLQGKAVVKYPANSHTEPLNLYTLTVSPPGERKSGTFKALMQPVVKYVQRYNEIHALDLEQNRAERAFLERQRQTAMKGRTANLERVQELTKQLSETEELHALRLTAADVTPEALAWEMFQQSGRMAVMDDEGSVFDTLSGIYNTGQANINLFLKSYDGSPHTILRRTSDSISLDCPLLTMGIMTQPQQFRQAMATPQFSGRGLVQRFLYSFPEGRAGQQTYTSSDIPQGVQRAYNELIERLLRLPASDTVIVHDRESYDYFQGYFELLQDKMKPDGMFGNMKDYAAKMFGKVLRIAGLLHLCEHSADEPITGRTAMNAVNIGLWAENMSLRAFDGGAGDDELTKNAKYMTGRLKALDCETISLTNLKRQCRAIADKECFAETVKLLEDMHYLRRERLETAGRPSELYHINPFI